MREPEFIANTIAATIAGKYDDGNWQFPSDTNRNGHTQHSGRVIRGWMWYWYAQKNEIGRTIDPVVETEQWQKPNHQRQQWATTAITATPTEATHRQSIGLLNSCLTLLVLVCFLKNELCSHSYCEMSRGFREGNLHNRRQTGQCSHMLSDQIHGGSCHRNACWGIFLRRKTLAHCVLDIGKVHWFNLLFPSTKPKFPFIEFPRQRLETIYNSLIHTNNSITYG